MAEDKQCEKCGEMYEAYIVLVKDDFSALSDFQELKEEWGDLCKDCRVEESSDPSGFAMTDLPE